MNFLAGRDMALVGRFLIAGALNTALSWGVSNHMPSSSVSLELGVVTLPAAYARPVETHVLFNALGRATECTIQTSSGDAQADAAACSYIMGKTSITPLRSGAEVTPVAVRSVSVTLAQAEPRK